MEGGVSFNQTIILNRRESIQETPYYDVSGSQTKSLLSSLLCPPLSTHVSGKSYLLFCSNVSLYHYLPHCLYTPEIGHSTYEIPKRLIEEAKIIRYTLRN